MASRKQRAGNVQRRSQLIQQPNSSMPLLVIGGIVAAIVVAAALIAVALTSTAPTTSVAQPAATITISGDPLPPVAEGSEPAAGMLLPELAGTDINGQPMMISAGDGPMVVVVLAHWCPHCQAEVPVLVDYLAEGGAPDGVEVVALTTSIDRTRPNYPPSAWLEREGWTVPTLVDDVASSGLQALGVTSFPGFVFVDGEGRVVGRFTGELGAANFDQALQALAGGSIVPDNGE